MTAPNVKRDGSPSRLAILGTRGIPARYGGFETFAEQLSVRLAARGIEVTVYCEKGEQDPPPSHRGVRLVHLPAPSAGPLTTVLFDARCLWHARRSFDVVYMLGYGAAPFCVLPRLWGTRVWLNPDGIEWARAKWGLLARTYFKAMELCSTRIPDRVIADAWSIRDHLVARHGCRRPVSVVPYGAPVLEIAPDPGALAEWDLLPDRYFLVVCRLEPENHVSEIVHGFRASASTRTLVVVGNHLSQSPYVRRLTSTQDPRIRFIGTVFEPAKLQTLRYHAFAYCHGHSVGGTNPSLLEALGCGNAVIAHDNPHNREVARDSALYFRTIQHFAEQVHRIESDETMRHRMRDAARRTIASDYSWERIADAYVELFQADSKEGS